MNLLYIGCLYSELDKELFLNASRRGYQYASQNLQEAIIEGLLCNNENFSVITIPSLSSYPFGNKLVKIKDSAFVYQDHQLGNSFGYLNIRFLRRVPMKKVDAAIRQWIGYGEKPRRVIVYGMHPRLMAIAAKIKTIDPETKLCIIIPDLPEYMGENWLLEKLGHRTKKKEKAYSLLQFFDSFAVLAEGMIEKIPVSRPYVVVEGMYRGEIEVRNNSVDSKEKIIMYSGGLHSRYGIIDLLQAFRLIHDPNYRLWLCGTGDSVPIIKENIEKDNRIQYLGSLPSDKVRDLQQRATLLINPRHSNEEFTRYSFPSKTIEYLASGTPVLMSHLPCIPSEYDDYLFYFRDESLEGMRDAIIDVCSKKSSDLKDRGLKAQSFIRKQKTPKSQVNKILKLLSSLDNKDNINNTSVY